MKRLCTTVTVAAALAMVGGPSVASAACSAKSLTFRDLPNDGTSAPEIAAVRASVANSCSLRLGLSVSNRPGGLGVGDFLAWYIDSDDDRSTGQSSGFTGADYVVSVLSTGFANLSRYSSGKLVNVKQVSYDAFGVTIPLSDLSAGADSTLGIYASASYKSESGESYYDFAPEAGTPAFSFRIGSVATPTSTPAKCKVPKLRGLRVDAARKRLKAAHCKLGKTKVVRTSKDGGKVIKSSPARGAKLANGSHVNLTVGRASRSH